MPKIENTKVAFLEDAVAGSKFPMAVDFDRLTSEITDRTFKLATAPAGSGHDNFLKGITVMFDLTLSEKAWPQAERYHFLEFVSSSSTMHRLNRMDVRNCCNPYVTATADEDFLRMIYNVPSGFELTARMVTNYQQLKTIYRQRRTHRLPDWQMFCDWIESLPHSELITGARDGR